MILRLLCIWLAFYSLLSSLMQGTMNLKFHQVAEHTGCLIQTVQNGPRIHPAFYSMGDRDSFLESKAAGALH
jgi:hypothetical protein